MCRDFKVSRIIVARPETNMASENKTSQKEIHSGSVSCFCGSVLWVVMCNMVLLSCLEKNA